jgi:hypothetical protein
VRGRPDIGKRFELGGLGCPDRLEDIQRLPEHLFRPGGVAGGQGAPAQASQCMSLIPGAADLPGQAQGLLVTRSGLAQVPAESVQRPGHVQGLDLTAPVADVTVEAQRLL